jgi:X-X-X-Leu-X-X-Gly heptad repeat protein
VEDGQAQIKQYEDGQQQLASAAQQLQEGQQSLASGKTTLVNGYSQYNAGVDQLNAGAAKLASGKAQLSVYEDGEDQVAAGLDTLIAQEPIMSHDGKTVVVESIASRLGRQLLLLGPQRRRHSEAGQRT